MTALAARGTRFASPVGFFNPRGRARVEVGASIWQTPGGVASELARINDDVLMFSAEIAAWVGAKNPADLEAKAKLVDDTTWFQHLYMGGAADVRDALTHQVNERKIAAAKADVHPTTTDSSRAGVASFYVATWIPFLLRWSLFYNDNKSWTDNVWWNHAPEAEQFADQLGEIREGARKLGMDVRSPEPSKWGKSLLDPSRDPTKPAGELFNLAKIAVYGGLALIGIVAIASVASNLKTGKDPAEKYLALATGRQRRR